MTRNTFTAPIRWGDMDAQGHVNNALYVDYLQEARAQFLLDGPNHHMLGGGVVVVGHQIEYLRPISYSDRPMEIELAVAEVGAARFVIGYELRHDGELCARATTILCPFDFTAGTPRRMTRSERDHFMSVQRDLPAMRPLEAPALSGRGHHHPLQVRWSDLDSYGHVNNVRYFDYVQEARIAMTTEADPATARLGMTSDAPRYMWLVARQDVDYVVQMDYRLEPYDVVTAPVGLGSSSAVIACEITDPLAGGKVMARARTVLVCADPGGRPMALPDETRAAMEPLIVD
ncbi:MAG TPA: thioesterase family protein [Propionibacteriaceae bacterium]|nr:thioesterase family protein [Propionibacteriaceae bacterium]